MPKSEQSEVTLAKQAQSAAAKRATIEDLRAKKPKRLEFTMEIDGEERSFVFVGYGGRKYDKLYNQFPATTEQLARGEGVNIDKFAPELLSRVCKEPELSVADWTEIWNSEDWTQGELISLYNQAGFLCVNQAPISPINAD